MPLREAILSKSEKEAIAATAVRVTLDMSEGWEDEPESAQGGGLKGVDWENQFGDLDAYRRYEGKFRTVLEPVTMDTTVPTVNPDGTRSIDADGNPASHIEQRYDDKATKSLAQSIKTRLTKCFPSESWSVRGTPEGIKVGYSGTKAVRSVSGPVVVSLPSQTPTATTSENVAVGQ